MKKIYALLVAVALSTTLFACGSSSPSKDTYDESKYIFLGDSRSFTTQEAAEALLTAKDIPYTITNAGTTSNRDLAKIENAIHYLDFGSGSKAQRGYHIRKNETAVLLVYEKKEKSTNDIPNDNTSNYVYIGNENEFKSQETAEAILSSRGIPYTVVDAGVDANRTKFGYYAFIEEAMPSYDIPDIPDKILEGYYVKEDVTVILLVYKDAAN